MNSNENPALDEVIAEYLLAVERGQAPGVGELLARNPDHAMTLLDFLRDLGRFGGLIGMDSLVDPDGTTAFLHHPGDGTDPGVIEPFGGYELLEKLGEGGMGTVYRARLAGTELIVALKQIRADLHIGAAARRFREEIERAAELKHPNIVPLYHIGEHGGNPFFTMALVEGGSLDRHLARFHQDHVAAARLMTKIARGIHHAHQRRLLHRDLKPANVLLDVLGEPLIADFGLATRTNEAGRVAESSPPSGSLPWMAPETLRAEPLTTAVDIWALGVMLYELLTGRRPFVEQTPPELRQAILRGVPPLPRSVNPRISRNLEAICLRCLAANPEQRYESASAVALELERWLRDEPVRARKSGPAERFARWCRRSPGLAAGLALTVITLTVLTVAGMTSAGEMGRRLAESVCRNNEYAARQLAVIVRGRYDAIGDDLLRATADPELSMACQRGDRAHIEQVLQRLRQSSGGGRLKNLFVLNPAGNIIARSDQLNNVPGKAFTGRDYFRKALEKSGRDHRGRVHIGRVFESESDGFDKLPVSVAFLPEGESNPWVLVATITTDATIGQKDLPTDVMKAALIAPADAEPSRPAGVAKPPGYVIMAHPALGRGERTIRFPAGEPGPVPENPETTPAAPFPPNLDYRDPVGGTRHPDFRDRWLAGSARVDDSELIVLVQQRYDVAVTPHEGVFGRFLFWAGGLTGTGFVVFLVVRHGRLRRTTGEISKS